MPLPSLFSNALLSAQLTFTVRTNGVLSEKLQSSHIAFPRNICTISRILRLSLCLSLIRCGFKETISDTGSRDAAHCNVLKQTEML